MTIRVAFPTSKYLTNHDLSNLGIAIKKFGAKFGGQFSCSKLLRSRIQSLVPDYAVAVLRLTE